MSRVTYRNTSPASQERARRSPHNCIDVATSALLAALTSVAGLIATEVLGATLNADFLSCAPQYLTVVLC